MRIANVITACVLLLLAIVAAIAKAPVSLVLLLAALAFSVAALIFAKKWMLQLSWALLALWLVGSLIFLGLGTTPVQVYTDWRKDKAMTVAVPAAEEEQAAVAGPEDFVRAPAGQAATPPPPAQPGDAPDCPAMPGGYTNCSCMEQWLDTQLMVTYGISDPGLLGTQQYPIAYPAIWLHDMCYAKSSGGTGAKYVELSGPAALQMGEATGPLRMVYVPSGTVFRGWTQGGWLYTTDDALLNQWRVENEAVGLLGLICGYQAQMGQFVPAYRWDGASEVRDEALDCPLPWPPDGAQLSSTQLFDAEAYPEIFKIEANGIYYCGARNRDAQYPVGARLIETWPKTDADGNYLHDGGEYGMSVNVGFCKGQPVDAGGNPVVQTTWTTVLLEVTGLVPVTFPLQ